MRSRWYRFSPGEGLVHHCDCCTPAQVIDHPRRFAGMGLTVTQKRVLDFLRDFHATHGFSPTMKEICAVMEWNSKSQPFAIIEALEERGWIAREPGKERGISLL
jgi:repressor LexA